MWRNLAARAGRSSELRRGALQLLGEIVRDGSLSERARREALNRMRPFASRAEIERLAGSL